MLVIAFRAKGSSFPEFLCGNANLSFCMSTASTSSTSINSTGRDHLNMVSVKLSLIPNFAIWDLPHDYPPTLSIPTVDKSSIFSRAPFSIPENLFFRSLDYKWPLLLASSYVLIVKTWNFVNRQRGGKPWAISKTSGFFWFMVAHNVFLAVYSAWTFVGIVGAARRSFENPFTSPNGFRGTMDSLCRMQGTSGLGNAAIYNSSPSSQSWFKSHPLTAGTTQTAVNAYLPKPDQLGRLWNEGLAFYGWWFYISKFYEFIDTAIILLKGKQSSTLQTYHHMGACGCLFVGIKYMSPPIWIFLFFNSFIHSLMVSATRSHQSRAVEIQYAEMPCIIFCL